MSLLLANGHPDARRYPIWLTFEEARLAHRRKEQEMAALAVLIQMGMAALPNMAAKSDSISRAARAFQGVVKKTLGG